MGTAHSMLVAVVLASMVTNFCQCRSPKGCVKSEQLPSLDPTHTHVVLQLTRPAGDVVDLVSVGITTAPFELDGRSRLDALSEFGRPPNGRSDDDLGCLGIDHYCWGDGFWHGGGFNGCCCVLWDWGGHRTECEEGDLVRERELHGVYVEVVVRLSEMR